MLEVSCVPGSAGDPSPTGRSLSVARAVPASLAEASDATNTPHSPPFIAFVEPHESFLALSIRNFGLTLATLGFYSFWARAEARQHLHRSIRIGGRPLDYTGTGNEAFGSFVLGMMVAVIVLIAFLTIFTQSSSAAGGEGLAVFAGMRWQRLTISLPLLFLLGSVVYRRRKHTLRRTWIGGQNFDLEGRPWSYALQHFWTAFLVPATLGWAAPWRSSQLEQRKIREMRFGDVRFTSVPNVGPLYRAFAILWFGGGTAYVATMILLGLSIGPEVLASIEMRSLHPLLQSGSAGTALFILGVGLSPVILLLTYYRAAWIEHQVSSLAVGDMRLNLKLPKFRFALLMLWGAALKILSLGAFSPVADAQLVRFLIGHVRTHPHSGLAA